MVPSDSKQEIAAGPLIWINARTIQPVPGPLQPTRNRETYPNFSTSSLRPDAFSNDSSCVDSHSPAVENMHSLFTPGRKCHEGKLHMREHSSSWSNDDDHDTHASSTSVPQPTHATLVVTTTEDIVDASDGVLSLREAVTAANLREGADTITFDRALSGQTVLVRNDDEYDYRGLEVTDDLIIDGGAPAEGITLSPVGSRSSHPVFDFHGTDAHVKDLRFQDGTDYGSTQINSYQSNVTVEQCSFYGGKRFSGGMLFKDSIANIKNTSIDGIGGEFGPAIQLYGRNEINIFGSDISSSAEYSTAIGNGYQTSYGILSIEDSTIEASAPFGSVGIDFGGVLLVRNSTIDAVSGDYDDDAYPSDRALVLRSGGSAFLDNVTIVGPNGERLYADSSIVEIEQGAFLFLENSIIVDDGNERSTTISGEYIDAGGNVLTDRDGVTISDVFVSGRLEFNGGPTRTVALLDDPSNPAIGAADLATASLTDQRGVVRDAAPDAGAFEAGAGPITGSDPLPDLAEKQPLALDEITGADPTRFILGEDRDASITFLDEYAGDQNVLGVYLIGSDGYLLSPKIVFNRIEDAQTSDLPGVSQNARPGGGPLHAGDTVMLSDLYDPDQLQADMSFGLFLIADGASKNDADVFENNGFYFSSTDGRAFVMSSGKMELHQYKHEDGIFKSTLVVGDIFHSVDRDPFTPLVNDLNPDGKGHVTSGLVDGNYILAFEDRNYPIGTEDPAHGDGDFNDLILAIDATETLDALSWASGGVV
ncbi:MAG: CSLREA domain-containing protein [Geminicoccaceae bacterium]